MFKESCRPARNFRGCENSSVTGITIDGGYDEHMVAPNEVLVGLPAELDVYQGAPLMCAGRSGWAR
ncbi:MAG: hypothetical protein ABSB35_36695 [Bryobacteraceae bacterium]